MMIKKKDVSHLLKNKFVALFSRITVLCVILLIIIFLTLFIWRQYSYRQSLLYKKLQGPCNIEIEKSYIYRNFRYIKPLDISYLFIKEKVTVPILLTSNDDGIDYDNWIPDFDKAEEESTGRWEIISTSPDSILIETPKSILNGRYAVTFKKEKGVRNPKYYVMFSNDSSMIVCYKMYAVDYPFLKDWEKKDIDHGVFW